MTILQSILNFFTRTDRYIVPKGEHYAIGRNPKPIDVRKHHKWRIYTDESWRQVAADQTQANKVFGVTKELNPHINSLRLCFSYENGHIVWRSYGYTFGVRFNNIIFESHIEDYVDLEILDGKMYLDGILMDIIPFTNYGWTCSPYIGGVSPASRDFLCRIKKIK